MISSLKQNKIIFTHILWQNRASEAKDKISTSICQKFEVIAIFLEGVKKILTKYKLL